MQKYFFLLLKVPLFYGIEAQNLSGLLACIGSTRRSYAKNEMIFNAGDKVTSLGIVLCGNVQIIKEDMFGNRTIISQIGTGELFAEDFSCAQVESLPVSIKSVSDSEILFIYYRRILTTCTSACVFHNRLIENMVGILARKNVVLGQKIDHLSQRTTREKLLSFLSGQAQKAGSNHFIIPYNREELADYLCVERSAMSHELGKMRNEGLLRFKRSEFELNPDLLDNTHN
jgi:CRP-like cAMP-binding protein